mgnify:FL=1
MNPIIEVLIMVLNLYKWSLVIYILVSLLAQFGIINRYHSIVDLVQNSLSQIHEPLLSKVRRLIPIFGNLDLSPLIVFIGIEILIAVIITII